MKTNLLGIGEIIFIPQDTVAWPQSYIQNTSHNLEGFCWQFCGHLPWGGVLHLATMLEYARREETGVETDEVMTYIQRVNKHNAVLQECDLWV